MSSCVIGNVVGFHYGLYIMAASSLMDVFIICLFLKGFLGYQNNRKVLRLILPVLSFAFLLASTFCSVAMYMDAAFTLAAVLILSVLCKGNAWAKFTAGLIYTAFSTLTDLLFGMIFSMMNHMAFVFAFRFTVSLVPQGAAASRLFLLAVVFLIFVRKGNRLPSMPFRSLLLLSILPVSSIILICTLGSTFNSTHQDEIGRVIGALGLMASNGIVFFLFERQAEQESLRSQNELLSHQMELQRKYFTELAQRQSETRRMWHDMKNTLTGISGYVASGQNEEALRHLSRIGEDFNSVANIADTGNAAIDAVLQAKKRRALQSGISLILKTVMPDTLGVDPVDLAVVLANGLDNAIEACEKTEAYGDKEIQCELIQKGDYLSLRIANPTHGTIGKGGKTTKTDQIHHGYGLQSVQKIAEKYDGDVYTDDRDSVFTLNVLLKNPLHF